MEYFSSAMASNGKKTECSTIQGVIITITIFSNLIGALTMLFFTNYYVGLKSDSWL